ncbi:MAG: DUF92 domain-containing protein, partial [Candidatus Aenigmarchaeota archaeon]|nr:DUF92 domain-containing protein [Candidatus Aenigmarchaeota archaeon]
MFEWVLYFFGILLLIALLLTSRSFKPSAIIMSVVFGTVIYVLHGFLWLFVIFLFMGVSLYATHSLKKDDEKKHEIREVDNVISNGLVAFMSAVFNFPIMYLGSISAALADTLSSEIGSTSNKTPRMILNITKQVPKGTNGGITIMGLLAAILGAGIIATLAFLFSASFSSMISSTRIFIAVFIAGILGSIIDSILGAVFENKRQMSNGSVN